MERSLIVLLVKCIIFAIFNSTSAEGATNFTASSWKTAPPSTLINLPPLSRQSNETSTSELKLSPLVFNGDPLEKILPFIAVIVFVENGVASISCGGSVIDSLHILTAAHCIDDSIFQMEVWIGPSNLDNFYGQRIEIAKTAVHPWFRGKSNNYWYDIGILELASPVKNFDKVEDSTICVGTGSYDNRQIVLVGFGKFDGYKTSRILRSASGRAVGINRCLTLGHPGPLKKSQICAQVSNTDGEAADAASGDSGGPLFTKFHFKYVQIGIVSYGFQTIENLPNTEIPGTYTLVGKFQDFISYYAPQTKFCAF